MAGLTIPTNPKLKYPTHSTDQAFFYFLKINSDRVVNSLIYCKVNAINNVTENDIF